MRLRYLAFLLPVLFLCCNKNGSSIATKPPAPFSFTTKYDSVYTCYPESNITLSFNVNVLSGDIYSAPVVYSITNLPSAITSVPTMQTVRGVLGGAFTFTVGNMPPGTYTANLIIDNSVSGKETHTLTFNVLKPIDYSLLLAGTYYHSYDFCQPDSFFYYTSVVSTVADTPYLVKIGNIKNLGSALKIRALISKVVTVPMQSLGGYTIWGTGTFFKDTANLYKMIINDTLVSGLDTEYCTIHIEH